jgi:epoxide hydrolase-like predicted phosphatase
MSNDIRAVVFDVGGVLVRTFDQSGRRTWEQRLGLNPGSAEAIVLNSEMGHKAQRGEISTVELWQWVDTFLDLGLELDAFRRDFWKGDAVDQNLVNLLRILRPRYQTAILSNAPDNLSSTLEQYGLLTEVDLVVGSAYEGVMKPDVEIYHRVLTRLGRVPSETIFIDDALPNVIAAQSIGILGIHYRAGLDLASELRNLGMRV